MAGSIAINSNIAALQAQRRLGQSTRDLQQTLGRLSSGLRINRAAEDAAGLAIASDLNTDQRVLNQGIRNLNDGLSATSIADATIESLSSIVTRLAELAEQAANGTLGWQQRQAIDKEAQSLSKEYLRIAKSAEFNGRRLLDGSIDELRLQAGYGVDGAIESGFGGAMGDGTFQARTSYTTAGTPRGLVTGDFNSDGITDAISCNNSSVSVLLGNGDGTLRARTDYGAFPTASGLAAGDLNGDGILDLATCHVGSAVRVLLGNGDGSFKTPVSYPAGNLPSGIAAADFNCDGNMDLATADQFDNVVAVSLGRGDGTFSARSAYSTGMGPNSITAADLNNDGAMDLVTTDITGNSVSVLLGNNDGTFQAPVSYAAGSSPRSAATADLNGDGILDLVTADGGSASASVLLGKGDGTFHAKTSYTVGTLPTSVFAGDLNGDGALDLATADQTSATASILLGNGDGTFRARSTCSTGATPATVLGADFNRDGVMDLIATDSGGNSVSVLLARTGDGVSPLLPFSLSTKTGAKQALPVFKEKLALLSSQRGEIGAFQARIVSAISTVRTASENYSAAASQIMEADFAEESAQFVKTRILQQAGSAVLAQASRGAQLALSLLNEV